MIDLIRARPFLKTENRSAERVLVLNSGPRREFEPNLERLLTLRSEEKVLSTLPSSCQKQIKVDHRQHAFFCTQKMLFHPDSESHTAEPRLSKRAFFAKSLFWCFLSVKQVAKIIFKICAKTGFFANSKFESFNQMTSLFFVTFYRDSD